MNARKLFLTLTITLATCFTYSVRAVAQVRTETATPSSVLSQIAVENLPSGRSLDLVLQMDPKGGSTAVTVHQNGPVNVPDTFVPPALNTEVQYKQCKKGTLNFYGTGVKVPCAGAVLGSFRWGSPVTIDASPLVGSPGPTPQQNKSVSMSGFTPTFQLRGFGGAGFINSNTPATSGFDGAVLFPLGNRVLVGPSAGFQWVGSAIVQTIGGGQPGSTFIHTDLGLKSGNFGGQLAFPIGRFMLGLHGGATVAGSSITQAEGFCGTGGPTAPAGCTVFSSTKTHDTVVGPFVGGYISHSIFSHVGVFAGYDYLRLKDTTSAGTTTGSSTGGKQTLFDARYNMIIGGVTFTFGGYHEH